MSAKPVVDTTDYWHVKVNNNIVARLSETSIYPSIQFDIKKINESDALSVEYGNDTPCYDCITNLYLIDPKNKKIILAEGKGTFNPLTVSMLKLKQLSKKLGRKNLRVYYTDNFKRDRLIFRLNLKKT
nr:hypothetical protein [Mucilaginibacter sp. L294]